MKIKFKPLSFFGLAISAPILAYILHQIDPTPSETKQLLFIVYGFVWSMYFPMIEVIKDEEKSDSNN